MANEQQPTPQQEQAPAPAPQQQNNAVVANPLKGVHLTAQLQPFANALAAPYESFVECFIDKAKGVAAFHKEIEFVVQLLTASGKPADFLRQCFMSNPLPLVNAVKQVALTGLSLNPVIKQSYLVPFKGVVTFMPSYAGMCDILTNTGLCSKIDARLVYTDEFFEIEHGYNEHLIHKPNPWGKRELKDVFGGYWYAVLPDGTKKFDTMSVAEINKIRAVSPSANNGPWVNWTEEMMKKTILRRAFKSLPHAGISEDKLKVLEAVIKADDGFFFEEGKRPAPKPVSNFFNEEPIDATYAPVAEDETPAQ